MTRKDVAGLIREAQRVLDEDHPGDELRCAMEDIVWLGGKVERLQRRVADLENTTTSDTQPTCDACGKPAKVLGGARYRRACEEHGEWTPGKTRMAKEDSEAIKAAAGQQIKARVRAFYDEPDILWLLAEVERLEQEVEDMENEIWGLLELNEY